MNLVRNRKTQLRKQIKEKISALPLIERETQSDRIFSKVINLPEFKSSQRISVYLSTKDEVSTDNLVKKMFELHKKIFVPRYNGDLMQMVLLNSLQDWETLPLTKWNIKQPSADETREDALETGGLDLIIAPGVAFTTDGWRMGHGKGYYDQFFKRVFASQPNMPCTVGICFKEQIVQELPTHEHDVRLDQVIVSE